MSYICGGKKFITEVDALDHADHLFEKGVIAGIERTPDDELPAQKVKPTAFNPAPTAPSLHEVPMIIDGPGDYVTRSGKRVTIHSFSTRATFNCQGQIWRMFRGKMCARGYEIWHPSGRARAVGEHPNDIVSKVMTVNVKEG